MNAFSHYLSMSFGFSSQSFGETDSFDKLRNFYEKGNKYTASPKDPERSDLLNQKITGITIGLSTMTPKTFDLKLGIACIIKPHLPWFVIPPALYHASILLHSNEKTKDGTVIEFGFYKNYSKHKHPNKVHYWNQDGLRFSKMTYDQYKKYVGSEAINIMHFFDCEIKFPISLKCLIHRCSIGTSWRACDYHAELNNCQSFVAVAINELQARRKKRNRSHSLGKIGIPHRILQPLEDNEKRFFTSIEKIPLIGPPIGLLVGGLNVLFDKIIND